MSKDKTTTDHIEKVVLTNLLANLQEGILLEDTQRRILLASQKFCDMFGITAPPEALVGSDCSDAAEKCKHLFKNPKKFVSDINQILANKQKVFADELELVDGRHYERDYIPTFINDEFTGHLWKYRDISERKQTGKRIEKSEERFRQVVEQSMEVVWEVDAEGLFTYVSPLSLEVYGYSPDQMVRKMHFLDLYPDDSIDQYKESNIKVFSKIESFKNLTHPVLRRDGKEIIIKSNGIPLVGINGDLIGFRGIDADITEHVQTEQILNARLRLTEFSHTHSRSELLQKLLEELEKITNSRIGFFHSTGDNQNIVEIQSRSNNSSKLMYTEQSKGVPYGIDKSGIWMDCVNKRKAVIHNDYLRLPHRNGSNVGHTTIIRQLMVPVFRNEQIVALVGIGNKPTDYNDRDIEIVTKLSDLAWDITERKAAEESLQKLSQAVEQSPVIVFITNLDGVIEYANPKASEVSGFSNKELTGKYPRIFSSFETPKEEYENLRRTICSGKEWKGEFHNKKKNGELFWVSASITPVTDYNGKISHYLAVEEDVTERKIMEGNLRELNATLEHKIAERTSQLAESNANLEKENAERIHASSALADALDSLHKIADRIPGVVYQLKLNSDGSIEIPFASKGIHEIYGLKPEEVAQDASIIITKIHPDDVDNFVSTIRTSAKDMTLWSYEHRVMLDDGSVRWLRGEAMPQPDNEGGVLWHGFTSDITEHKKTDLFEKELLDLSLYLTGIPFSEISSALDIALQRVGSFLNADRAYIFELNIDQKTMTNTYEWCNKGINPEIENLQGIETENFLLWMDHLQKKENLIIPDVEKLPDAWRSERELLLVQGIKSLLAIPMFSENNLIGFIGLDSVLKIREYTETEVNILKVWGNMLTSLINHKRNEEIIEQTRKKNEEEIMKARSDADKANLAKSIFLSHMSEELRTPMNSILGFAQLLDMSELQPSQKKGVSHILSNGNQLLSLINGVLDISGIETGRQIVLEEPVNIKNIIQELIETFKSASDKRQQTVKFVDLPFNDSFVLGDSQRLKQVLFNIINNAIKFSREGGFISIKTDLRHTEHQMKPQLRISITDTGYGINSDAIQKLFMPFERIGESINSEGARLGLAVVKQLMDAMGGKVGVDSVPGSGSTFWIELPYADIMSGKNEQKPDISSVSRVKTILYTEDNISNIELMEQIIGNNRPNIRLISSMYGKHTLKLAIDHKPDLILLDLNLADMHGIEVLEELLAEPETSSIPVIIVSGDAMPHQIEKLINAGAADYLTKPIDISEFLKIIDKYITR